jgi:hypothetical protein
MMMQGAFSVSTLQGPEKWAIRKLGSFQSAMAILSSLTPLLSLFSFSLSSSDSSLQLLYQAQAHGDHQLSPRSYPGHLPREVEDRNWME